MKLIEKDALVAEIERLKTIYKDDENIHHIAKYNILVDILSFIDTLEVKELDLEKEIKEEYLKSRHYGGKFNMLVILNESQFNDVAKHFFELGLRSTITEEDCKLIWNIGDEIPNMPEEEFFKELLKRYKAQKKGE